ncbi:MAG: prepilin-type N-terminal cleavage/methylation domain-containing protein [Lachnospiraceae bacterium]|nr:prepilin-type N-terminal cleavage/methylation domain-containing protein [Lachnospiraceae bacterium]
MRENQKGFTIIEVLIATVILSIVVLTVCAFIMVGSKSYAAGNSDINVQQESQLALNQMSDVVIDTTRSVNYVGYDASGNTQKALKDAEFTFTPEDKSLIMYNGVVEETAPAVPGGATSQTVNAGNGNKHYHFYWSKDAETLYYAELDVQPSDVDTASIHFPTFDSADPAGSGWVKLAGHVTDFSVDLSQVEEKRVVQLALTFLDGTKEYVTSNNVTIRNKVGVNDAELAPLNKRKTLSVTPRDSGVILEPGETYHFSTPKVTGDNVADRSVTWSLATPGGNSPSGQTAFTDTANGILQVATDEPAGTIDVVITTNAVDSDGNHASCSMVVYIKRVSAVTLSKTDDEDADNGPNEVSAGSKFTIGAAIEGVKIGVECSGCTEPITHDFDVVNWRITQGAEFVEIVDAGDCMKATEYRVKAGTEVGTVIKIAATSELSQNRLYDDVHGEITLTVKKSMEDAEPYGGALKYGVETLDESIRAGLPTDYNQYVTAIRVVDNSGKEPDKVLLHFTIGGGNNLRIAPDLFDLDLNGSYTFYIQAIFPIAEDRYVEGQGGYPDSNDTIRDEYFSHLSKSRPYGYEGTKYRHGKVFYAKLDRPKLVYEYKGVRYSGKNITYDPVNIFTVGAGSGIVGEIRPVGYENIVEDNSAWTYISNSLYKGEGSNQSQWEKIYYANEDSIVDEDSIQNSQNIKYFGSNTLADGAVVIDPKGSMFMKREGGGDPNKACGSYHIVPGMLYQNKDPGHYTIIGWQGFDFPNLPRKVRYYEFDDSTIHVKINGDFTMDVNHEKFKGKLDFPLPKDMKNSSLFPNIESLDWQTSAGSLTVAAMPDGGSYAYNTTISYVRYRYIKSDNAWEVEPCIEEVDAGSKKIRTYCYGRYKCKADGTKWEFLQSVATQEIDLVCNLEGLMINGNGPLEMYFPLPSESNFPFRGGTTAIDCNSSYVAFNGSGNADTNALNNVRIKYEHVGNVHRIIFVNKYWEAEEYSAFECTDGATKWTKIR